MANPVSVQPELARRFAVEVVEALRKAGYEAYWAGGCVRDQLLGREPKDYDVATAAQPRQVRRLFGHHRTLALGASFGVITVQGPPGAGQIEVATFREDAGYSDGRHPDGVRFSTAREDASRRDFTINGLFYDPLEERVIDYVGGQEDLRLGVVRAIGNPAERFGEDKLRMLRAIRFTTSLGFRLDEQSLEAIRRMAGQICVVSPERISAEMRRVLTESGRAEGLHLLLKSGLAAAILPEVSERIRKEPEAGQRTLQILDRLDRPEFSLAMAVVLSGAVHAEGAAALGERWRLTNREIDRMDWLLRHHGALDGAEHRPWSKVQRVLVAAGAGDLLTWMEAERATDDADRGDVRWCREQLARPAEEMEPAPLMTGADLISHGVPQGPIYRELLEQVRDAQLDGKIRSKAQALELVDHIVAKG
ncbi:MAG: CCA tRNA nucleotidyltransferase [Thermoguttaceae bacterium]